MMILMITRPVCPLHLQTFTVVILSLAAKVMLSEVAFDSEVIRRLDCVIFLDKNNVQSADYITLSFLAVSGQASESFRKSCWHEPVLLGVHDCLILLLQTLSKKNNAITQSLFSLKSFRHAESSGREGRLPGLRTCQLSSPMMQNKNKGFALLRLLLGDSGSNFVMSLCHSLAS